MYYAVIHRPEADVSKIQGIRDKYDPTAKIINPHVTLLFPVSTESISEESIKNHVSIVAGSTQPFSVHMVDLELSWDQWLFLTAREGIKEYTLLHDELYKGELQQHLRTDIPFVPHISLGQFVIEGGSYSLKDPKSVPLDNQKYEVARPEAEELHLDYSYTATSVELILINDDFTETKSLAKFPFKTS